MKKVLLIKLEAPSYSSIGMEQAFHVAYDQVHSIDWQKVKFNSGGQTLALWDRIILECERLKPDLIFCQFQRDVLTPEHFKKLSEYAFVINYTEDVREDTSWHEAVAPHIGLTIFTNMDDCRNFWAKGLRAAYMMVSYNHIWYRPQPKTQKYYGDIIFVGNNFLNTNLGFELAQERMDMCKFMKDRFGDRFQAYGMGQENQALSPMQCVEAYNNCEIVITHNHFKREGYCSDRGLNSMACGAVTIHQHFEGLFEMFKDAPYKLYWRNFNQLYDYCEAVFDTNKYFSIDEIYRRRMNRYMIENHSWHNRIKFIKGFIKLQQHPDTPEPIIRRNVDGIIS